MSSNDTPFSRTLSLCSSLKVRDKVSHSYSSTGKITVFYILIFSLLEVMFNPHEKIIFFGQLLFSVDPQYQISSKSTEKVHRRNVWIDGGMYSKSVTCFRFVGSTCNLDSWAICNSGFQASR